MEQQTPQNNNALLQIQKLMENSCRIQAEMAARLVRTETRLSRLMLHEGMKDDGRNAIAPRKYEGATA